MKFGGTSVGSAERIHDVASIVAQGQKDGKIVVVVSAISGVTNLLVKAIQAATNKKQKELMDAIKEIRLVHEQIIVELGLAGEKKEELQRVIDNHLLHVESLLFSVYELGEITLRGRDFISSFGERMNIHIVSYALKERGLNAEPFNATEFIMTNDDFGNAKPFLKESAKKSKVSLQQYLDKNVVPVVTGFIGGTKSGETTTFGRGGSDYSATILGYCLDADEVWIWTDVDGAMTADPKIVKEARTMPFLSYDEATELSYFGAKVLHPLTIIPAEMKKIPVWIKNTFRPEGIGTKIGDGQYPNGHGIKAISSTQDLALVTLEGKGMIGVPGTAAKVFDSIAEKNINVLFISQASSEHNISFVVKGTDGNKTAAVLKETFRVELMDRRIEAIRIEENVALVAVIGANMKGLPGIAGKTFSALGDARINIIAIAQGSSELNISFIVQSEEMEKAVQSIHKAFALEKERV
ncbi:MAG TPA: aspartate kinase [Patescibacteria group bacterium]|nr:aspartate kinase [Patescibacteria group bacterium]